MPEIAHGDTTAALKLRDRVKDIWLTWYGRLTDWRALTDRNTATDLDSFRLMLPPNVADKFVAVQTPEILDEGMKLCHILASNEVEIEAVIRGHEPSLVTLAQQYEEAHEALYAQLMPIEQRVKRYAGLMFDGVSVEALDIYEPGPRMKRYKDHDALKEKADAEYDDDDDSAEASYGRSYKAEGDHDRAYMRVTKQAQLEDGLPIGRRIINPAWFACQFDRNGNVLVGVEDYEVELHACVEMMAGYGVVQNGARLMLSHGGKATESEALTSEGRAVETVQEWGETSATEKVRYTQIRTMEWHCIVLEGQGERDDGAIVIKYPNPFKGSTGYFVTIPTEKVRGSLVESMEPFLLPLMVEAQHQNALMSGAMALAWYEATRQPYQHQENNPVPPLDATAETKSAGKGDGDADPVIQGDLKLQEASGQSLVELIQISNERMQHYRSDEIFSGTGTAGESARHLARLQTAGTTKLAPVQAKCSATDKRVHQAIDSWVAQSGRTIYIATNPKVPKAQRESVQEAKVLELSPKMAKASIQLIVTTGADFPEAKYALWDMATKMMAPPFKIWGRTETRELMGIKNPQETEKRMIVDDLREMAATQMQAALLPLIQQRAQEIVDSIMPPPVLPPTPSQVPPVDAGLGAPSPDLLATPESVAPPVPMMQGPNGSMPDVAGAGMGMPQ